VLPSLALAAVAYVGASGTRPSGSVTDAGFSIRYGTDKLTVLTSAVVVASRCTDTDAIRGARRGPPHESRHAVFITRDHPADAVEDQPLELIRPSRQQMNVIDVPALCGLARLFVRPVIAKGPMSSLAMTLVRTVVSLVAARTLISP
jgi:hypothetical protein